jgi:formylmethanofuran dehydrogenase subunit E
MSQMLECGTHGKQPATYVCKHIVESLQSGREVGFYWSLENGEYDAICEACNDLSENQWEKQQADLGRLLCLGCFKDAAALNGTEFEGAA